MESRSEHKATTKVVTSQVYSILDTDMNDEMLSFATTTAGEMIINGKSSNQEIAGKLKEEFDDKYYPTWMCIVGKSFGCKINAQKNHYLCFQIDNKTIILYKYH